PVWNLIRTGRVPTGTVIQNRSWRLSGLKRNRLYSDDSSVSSAAALPDGALIQVFAESSANRPPVPAIQDRAQGCSRVVRKTPVGLFQASREVVGKSRPPAIASKLAG